jgi:hypothetical protein
LAKRFIPEDRLQEIDRGLKDQLKAADERWIDCKLAKARRDVEWTYLVFKAVLAEVDQRGGKSSFQSAANAIWETKRIGQKNHGSLLASLVEATTRARR